MGDVRAVLERAARGCLPGLRLAPGLDAAAIEELERRIGLAVPRVARELLGWPAGFVNEPFGQVSFGGLEDFGFEALCPKSLAVAGDGDGNFWVVDVDPASGAWGRVLFVCHDPPVVVLQAADLAEFVEQVLAGGPSGQEQASLRDEAHAAADRVWRDGRWIVSRGEAMASGDPLPVEFASGVPDSFGIADLRTASNGAGFAWGRSGPTAELRRCGAELPFAVQVVRGRSFWGRLLRGGRGP